VKTLPLNSGLGNFSVTLLVSGGQFPMVLECKFKLVPYNKRYEHSKLLCI